MTALNSRHLAWPLHLVYVLITLLVVACAQSIPTGSDRLVHAQDIAQVGKMQMQRISTNDFDVLAFVRQGAPQKSDSQSILTVYLEGDGHAWANRFTKSDDPTPLEPVALSLATQDPSANVAYLARPCQFVINTHYDRGCNSEFWTSRRYSAKMIEASNQALDQLKNRYHATQLVLIGYSGGGAIALLVAAQRKDVAKIITVAGNLDTVAWTNIQQLDPLKGSLNPADSAIALEAIPPSTFCRRPR